MTKTFVDGAQGFPQNRQNLNNALNSLDTFYAGSSAPSSPQAYQPWLDTSGSSPVLKIRDASNTTWITFSNYLQWRSPTITTLTSGAGATFTPNSSTVAFLVEVFGATGGGGGVDGQGSGTVAIGGAGGNGGYAQILITDLAQTFTYTIGAAGAGGAAGNNNGSDGGITSFVGSTTGTIQVTGGAGGDGALGTAVGVTRQGAGGAATGGDVNRDGNTAISGRWLGGDIYIFQNNGAPLFGFGDSNIAATTDGRNSLGLGAGGAGGSTRNVATNYAGGDGFRGEIRVAEYGAV